jgi:hypothetical protein
MSLSEISIVVPSGHIHPQKNLPSKTVRSAIMTAGRKFQTTPREATDDVIPRSGLILGKISTGMANLNG